MITTLTKIHKLEERYPFNEDELEILVRCHDELEDSKKNPEEDFLHRLALASPFTYYFLPGDELRDRVTWIEDHILPMGFPNQFRAAISADPFVDYANEGEGKSLERFIEGIADTGRRGPKEALRTLYAVAPDQPSAFELVDLCFRLALASDALTTPNLDKAGFIARTEALEEATHPIIQSLANACADAEYVTKPTFVDWAEKNLPMLSSPLSTFVHHLLFHQLPFPESRQPFAQPLLLGKSDIFTDPTSPLLASLAMTSSHFTGHMSRLYSSENDGRSFNRLEWALVGYEGPTLLAIKTDGGAIIGAFTEKAWKDAQCYYGSGDCFLFQASPEFKVVWSTGPEDHFMYMHYGEHYNPVNPAMAGAPKGLGFGGDLKSKPRFFIPDSLENCSAEFMDRTFEAGEILPESALEKFEISELEVWGVGDQDMIAEALRKREEHRVQADEAINRARSVADKSQFVKDLESGFTPSNLYKHKEDARGRHEYRVDDKHGGYKIDSG